MRPTPTTDFEKKVFETPELKAFLNFAPDEFWLECKKSVLTLIGYPVREWINYSLHWSSTTQGFTFWEKRHHKWNKICDNEGFSEYIDIPPSAKLLSIGFEWEANQYKTNFWDFINKFQNLYSGKTSENSIIKEAQITPIKFEDFPQFLRTFLTISLSGGFKLTPGKEDEIAGSGHTHLKFEFLTNIHDDTREVKNLINFVNHHKNIFQRKIGVFRDAISRRAESTTYLPQNSKSYAITYNTYAGTIEVRKNESPFPLWVYLVPIVIEGKKLTFKNFESWLKTQPISEKEMLYEAMGLYFKANFDAKKVVKHLVATWRDKEWLEDYIPKIQTYNPKLKILN